MLDCNDAFARIFGFDSREEMLEATAIYEPPGIDTEPDDQGRMNVAAAWSNEIASGNFTRRSASISRAS